MKLIKYFTVLILLIVGSSKIFAQKKLTLNDVKKYTNYFAVSKNFKFSKNILPIINKEASKSQFIGLAEVHQSKQLSNFTTALLKVLKTNGYNNFALEIGDYSTSILENISKDPIKTLENLKTYNKRYGRKKFPYIPFIFVDKKADADFIKEASKLDYNLWGIDREFEFSYLMHIDNIYNKSSKTGQINKVYKAARKVMKKVVFKDKVYGQSKYCWLLNEPTIHYFFNLFSNDKSLNKYTQELKNSWKIYCRLVKGKGGSLARAKYMRTKFDSLYRVAAEKEPLPKVLIKLGGVHLTHGKSQYKRYDVGKHLHEKAKANNTEFLSIRHVWRYKNGKDQINKKGWSKTRFLMQMGKKNKWTLIDLRPIKKMVKKQKLIVDKGTAWELKSYDWFLISPNDTKGKINR